MTETFKPQNCPIRVFHQPKPVAGRLLAFLLLLPALCWGTLVPRMNFEEMADASEFIDRDPGRRKAVEELVGMGPLPGQCGLVVSHGRRIVAAELFASTELLRPHWGAIVRSHLLEHPTADGRPSAGRALRFLARFASSPSERREGLGHGIEHHVRTDRVVGQALVLPTTLVHAGAFAR